MELKGDDVLFLLGAGASYDAGIPISNQMVMEIERLVEHDENWKPYRDLYYYLKSSINYSDGILGKFNEQFNVERLLIVISEIEKRDRNIMYPFIGAWSIRLVDLAGNSFNNLSRFHKLIRQQLIEWVGIRNYESANYYSGFTSLSTQVGQLMKVFTLNYDLCFETVVGKDKKIELGFTEKTNEWHYSNFDNENEKSYNLYKLHGSIDWLVKDSILNKSDRIEPNPELIFGIQHKMTSVDPYFYYSSKLREACLGDVRLINVIGYSYADEYVNNIFSQALNARSQLRLLNVSPLFKKPEEVEKKEIAQKLKLKNEDQVIIVDATAKEYMTRRLNKDYLAREMGVVDDDFPF